MDNYRFLRRLDSEGAGLLRHKETGKLYIGTRGNFKEEIHTNPNDHVVLEDRIDDTMMCEEYSGSTAKELISASIKEKCLLSEDEVMVIVCSAAQALRWAYDSQIIHSDLRSKNVALMPNGRVKVTGFRMPKVAENKSDHPNIIRDATSYHSPEMINDGEPSHESNMWSLGVILFELLELKRPFEGTKLKEIKKKICSGYNTDMLTREVSEEVKELLEKMMRTDPKERIHITDFMKEQVVRKYVKRIEELIQGENAISEEEITKDSLRHLDWNDSDDSKDLKLMRHTKTGKLYIVTFNLLCVFEKEALEHIHKNSLELNPHVLWEKIFNDELMCEEYSAITAKELISATTKECLLSEDEVMVIVCSAAQALRWAYDLQIIHSDLRSENVVLMANGRVKVTGFRTAKVAENISDFRSSNTGIIQYHSPEMIKYAQQSHESNMWSLGVILFELLELKRPFEGDTIEHIQENICSGYNPKTLTREVSEEVKELLGKMMRTDPKERIHITDFNCLNEPVVKKYVKRIEELIQSEHAF